MKYKFNIGTAAPSAEKIDRHRDFKNLRANYDEAMKPLYKKPLYKDFRAFIVVLVILLLTYLLVEVLQDEEKKDTKQMPGIEKQK